MKHRTRIHYSERQNALMQDRWRRRESLQKIARLFDRNHASVQSILALSGGIRPPERRRSTRTLSLGELSLEIGVGQSMRTIAAALGRVPSTVSRELQRNDGLQRPQNDIGTTAASIGWIQDPKRTVATVEVFVR